MNPPSIVAAAAALLFALAPQSNAAALTQSDTAAAAPSSSTGVANHAGNVVAVVPGSSIAISDGIDKVLRRNRSYHADFVVWVAPNVRKATLTLHARGASLSRCSSQRLRPGATSAITCTVRGTANANRTGMSIDVVVRTSNFGAFSRTFTHAFTR